MEKHLRFEAAALTALTLMLVMVFGLSVWMYDDLAGETADGTLAVFAANVREFMEENDAVATFLGFAEDAPASVDPAPDRETVAAEAAAYIERYNRLYTDLP